MSTAEKYCTPEVARKVVYEFTMFEYLCDKLKLLCQESGTFIPGEITLAGTGTSSEEEREISAFLESLLLHARVLHDFFYKDREKDDVIASDFVDGWRTVRSSECKYFDAQKTRLNKALAHLTLKRVEYDSDEKKWDVTPIRSEIGHLIDKFKASLPQD